MGGTECVKCDGKIKIKPGSNGIENLNRQIRKATKNKLSFEKENRLLDYIFVVIKDFEKNWQKYLVHLFKN